MIKLVFSDLDETLLTADHHVPLVNQLTIQKAQAMGVKFVPATGRGYEMTKDILKEINLYDKEDEYVIAFNGGMIVECKGFKELLFQGLDYQTVWEIYQFGKDYDVCIEVFTPDCVYLFHANQDEIDRKTKQKANFRVIEDDDLTFLKEERLAKIIFQKKDMPYLHHLASLMHSVTDNRVQVSYSSGRYLEFNRLGVCKGQAISWLANYLGVSLEETMAIGDNENDISMLQTAGKGIAVAGAEENVKALADDVTLRDFASGAVAEALEKYVLH